MDKRDRNKRGIDYKTLNANKKFCNESLISDVAADCFVSQDLVRRVAESQSKYTNRTIKAGGLESIIYVYIGKFKINPRQVQKMMANSMRV